MKSFLIRHFRTIIACLLIVVAIFGMGKFKQAWEMTRSREMEIYFWCFDILFWSALGYLIISWLLRQWRLLQQLKNERTDAMLAMLKSKIDPHFFFNTLNNLYGLAVEKSDKTPEVILKLSEIMHYTIYEGERDRVSLREEISYLKKYIQIHKIRYKKEVSIHFEEELDREDYVIAPLLLVILLENAFKHGVESLTKGAFIRIEIRAKNQKLNFMIENNFDKTGSRRGGKGLNNLEKRLELIYPKRHKLRIEKDDYIFKAQLEIQMI